MGNIFESSSGRRTPTVRLCLVSESGRVSSGCEADLVEPGGVWTWSWFKF